MILRHDDYAATPGLRQFDADVVVVGTGAGGAVAGAELAEAGLKVLFVEEGGYHPTSSFNPYLSESIPRLYRDAGTSMILGKPPISFIEGRCVGGSTVLNGGMAYRAPEHVLEHWERMTGDATLGPAGLERHFERVESRASVGPQMEASIGGDNRLMAMGAERLGWRYSVNPRNQSSCVGANNCVFGCPTGAKQSTLVAYMPRALAAGAGCLTEVRVERLLIESGRAVGVVGRAIDPRTRRPGFEVEVRARAVIVAGGAMQSPYLLLRHRAGGRATGRNLLLHPNVKVIALYPFEVDGWQGVSQWCQIREFEDEGIVLAENMIPPSALAAHLPGHGEEAWELMTQYRRMIVSGALVEDSTSGRVRRGPGMPVATYDITAWDFERFKRGVRRLSQLHFTMGASQVLLPFGNAHYARSMLEVENILERARRARDLELFTVHLMGTCRLGRDPRDSTLDLNGEVWGLPGCYVADASVFPTAIGVNPQVTIMALATRIAERVGERLARAPSAARRVNAGAMQSSVAVQPRQ